MHSRNPMLAREQTVHESAAPRDDAIYRSEFTVPQDAIDGNGHVSNVAYVQWMQDIDIAHSRPPAAST